MTNKRDIVKNWKVLSAAIFLTAMLVVGSGDFRGVIASTDTSTDTSTSDTQTPTSGDSGVVSSSSKIGTLPPQVVSLRPSFTFPQSSFVQAGIGLRNVGSGTISVHTPTVSGVIKALLYWTMMDNGTNTVPLTPGLNTVYFNGEKITGVLLASAASPCWASSHIYVYRADVTNTLIRRGGQIDDQYVSVPSTIVSAISPWAATALQQAESAHLIVVFKDPSEPTSSTTKIFDATGFPGVITIRGGNATFTAPFAAAHTGGGVARVGYALADGQSAFVPQPNAKSFAWTSNPSGTTTTLNAGEVYGKDPSITSKAAYQGSLSDTEEYDVTANTPAGDTSGTLNWNFAGDCLTTVYAAVQG